MSSGLSSSSSKPSKVFDETPLALAFDASPDLDLDDGGVEALGATKHQQNIRGKRWNKGRMQELGDTFSD